MPDDLYQVLESTQAERLATDFVFTEGPLWHPDGHWLFVDIRRSLMFRVTPNGELSTFREDTNGANGLTFDLQGRLIMCEGDGRRISRQEPDGSMTTLAETSEGKRLNRPNDLVARTDGSIYFTNPAGRIAPADRDIDFCGVHRIAPDGSVAAVTGELDYPNGLAFSPDETVLYVAITRKDDGCIQEKERGKSTAQARRESGSSIVPAPTWESSGCRRFRPTALGADPTTELCFSRPARRSIPCA